MPPVPGKLREDLPDLDERVARGELARPKAWLNEKHPPSRPALDRAGPLREGDGRPLSAEPLLRHLTVQIFGDIRNTGSRTLEAPHLPGAGGRPGRARDRVTGSPFDNQEKVELGICTIKEKFGNRKADIGQFSANLKAPCCQCSRPWQTVFLSS